MTHRNRRQRKKLFKKALEKMRAENRQAYEDLLIWASFCNAKMSNPDITIEDVRKARCKSET